MKKLFIILIILPLILTGCKSSMIDTISDSVVDPQFEAKTYDTILVWSTNPHIQGRRIIEKAFSEQLNTKIQSYNAIEIAPPTRKYGDVEIKKLAAKHGIQGILIVDVAGEVKKKQFTTPEQKSYTKIGDTVYEDTTGGYTFTSKDPKLSTVVRLYDIESDMIAWQGEIQADGSSIHSLDDLLKKSVEELLLRLEHDKIVE